MDQLLSHWLKIRPDERRRTSLLFLFLFSSTSFIILGRTARDALLLVHSGIQSLPLMYVGIAVSTALMTVGYARMVARTSPYPILQRTLQASILGILLLRLAMQQGMQGVYELFYIFMEVSGSMLALLFWTFANECFSTREAKRLFSLIGSGGVMAGTVGGFGGGWFAPIVGTENLLWVCIAILLICMALSRAVAQAGHSAVTEARVTVNGRHEEPIAPSYVVSLSLLAVVTSVTVSVIDYLFKAVAVQKVGAQGLATYFGALYGISGLLSFLIQVLLASRLLTRWGILPALLMLPGVLLIGGTANVTAPGLASATFNKAADATLRYGLNDTCLQLLYLPLPVLQRRRLKAVVEGALRPAAIGVTGVALYMLGHSEPMLQGLSLFVLAGLLVWCGLAIWLRRGYVSALISTLSTRNGAEDDLPPAITDVASTQALNEALRSGDERIVLGALELVAGQDPLTQWGERLAALLMSPSSAVRLAAYQLYQRAGFTLPSSVREQWLVDLDDEIRAAAVERLGPGEGLEHFLADPSPLVRSRVVVGLVRRSVDASSQEALDVLNSMRTHTRAEQRLHATWALGELKGPEEHLRRMLQDPDSDVQRQGVEAIGKSQLLSLVPLLIQLLRHPSLGDEAAVALASYGEVVLGHLLAVLPELDNDEDHQQRVFVALRGIGTLRVAEELLRRLPRDRLRRHELLRLSYSIVRPRREGHLRLEIVRAPLLLEIQDCYQWWSILDSLPSQESWLMLRAAVEEEKRQALERALLLLAHAYPVRPIQTLHMALLSASANQLANAIEVLDELVEPDLRVLLIPLLEAGGTLKQVEPAQGFLSLVNRSATEWCRYFVTGEDLWLVVCALSIIQRDSGVILLPELRELLSHDQGWLKEAAFLTLYRLAQPEEQQRLLEQREALSLPWSAAQLDVMLKQGDTSMISSVEKVLFLRRVDLFSQLPGRELLNLAFIAEQVTFAEDSLIFEEGSEGDCLYLILSGQVRVSRSGRNIAQLGPRECFGEMAILDRAPRSATVTAIERVQVLRIERDSFYELLAQKREIALGIIRILVHRLRESNER
ncbi:MAG: Npt1/Npt2 family nucleotide transporter [Myxococcota bacterium]